MCFHLIKCAIWLTWQSVVIPSMRICRDDCRCVLCCVDTMVENPGFRARLETLIEEFQRDTTHNQEWIDWQKKYRAWNANTLDSYGIRHDGHAVSVVAGHPVLDLIRCNVDNLGMQVTDDEWQKIDSDLFESCCLTLRLRFEFLKRGSN